MKSIKIIAAALIFLSIISCKEDETLRYNNLTMGNAVEGIFTSDQGNIFNVVENPCKGDILAEKRSLVVCDILNKTKGGEENEYDVRLNRIARVLVKDIVTSDTELKGDLEADDPVSIENVWISGGYINMYIIFPIIPSSETPHIINLIENKTEEKGVYSFSLRHNAQGATVDKMTAGSLGLGGSYVSFPIDSFISEDEVKIEINWKWFKTTATGYSDETEEKSIKGEYKKNL